MSPILEKGGGGFRGIKLLLCENPLPPLDEAIAAARAELPMSNYYTEPYSEPLRRLLGERIGVGERAREGRKTKVIPGAGRMGIFVVQEHHGKRLHWDFRLEIGGVLKSWAVPKGPSLDPAQRRLAIRVPDHDLEHGEYEGIVPEGMYGAGPVLIWDKGAFEMPGEESAADGLRRGTLTFELHGKRLSGVFTLIRLGTRGRAESWLLIKKADTHARRGWLTPVLLTPARRKKLKETRPPCALEEG